MPDLASSPRISRRTLLKAGLAGGAALLLARWLYTSTTAPEAMPARPGALDANARAAVAAIAPVMLSGALPVHDTVLLQEAAAARNSTRGTSSRA
jgi:DMSO/TMAO reductase YedYZ molybdopterin-dependent catalytic subunit